MITVCRILGKHCKMCFGSVVRKLPHEQVKCTLPRIYMWTINTMVKGMSHANAPQAFPTPASAAEMRRDATTPKIRHDAEPVDLISYRSRILLMAGREQHSTACFGAMCR